MSADLRALLDRMERDAEQVTDTLTYIGTRDWEAVLTALRAVLDLAESWRYKGEFGWGPWQAGEGPDIEGQILDDAALDLRRAVVAALTPEAMPS